MEELKKQNEDNQEELKQQNARLIERVDQLLE